MIQSSVLEKMIQVSNDSEFRLGKNDSGFKQKMIQVGKNEFRFQMIQRSALFCKTENDSGSRYNSVSTSSRRTSLTPEPREFVLRSPFAQHVCTTCLHNVFAQRVCTTCLHNGFAQRVCTTRLHNGVARI